MHFENINYIIEIMQQTDLNHDHLLLDDDRRLKNKAYDQARNQEGCNPPRKNSAPLGKMCWTYFETIGYS